MPANHYFWYLYVVCHEKNNKVSATACLYDKPTFEQTRRIFTRMCNRLVRFAVDGNDQLVLTN